MRRAQQCRIPQAVCRRAAVTRAPRSRARLRVVTTRRRFMAKPCTPHLHSAGCAVLQAPIPQCRGSRGTPLAFLWGFQRGYSLRKENTPFGTQQRRRRCAPPALAKREKKSSLAAALFHFSQMTGFWRSDSTKALAFSTASARGSFTCSPVRISLQDTTPALISSSPRK